MFWYLLLSHFIADYPLQHPWIVRNKTRLWVLALHASIHLVVMFLIVGSPRWMLLPYLATLALVHFFIDMLKINLSRRKPHWVILPYAIDQTLHYLSLGLTTIWIFRRVGVVELPFDPVYAIYLTAYLFVTYVWYISELVVVYKDPLYRQELGMYFWQRMVSRAALLSLLLLATGLLPSAVIAAGIAVPIPYVTGERSRRALITDISISFIVYLFILIVT